MVKLRYQVLYEVLITEPIILRKILENGLQQTDHFPAFFSEEFQNLDLSLTFPHYFKILN